MYFAVQRLHSYLRIKSACASHVTQRIFAIVFCFRFNAEIWLNVTEQRELSSDKWNKLSFKTERILNLFGIIKRTRRQEI